MDPKDFLAAVVPWTKGYTTIHWQVQGKKGFPGRGCKNAEEAMRVVIHLHGKPDLNIYFGLSSQRFADGKRSRAHATGMGSIFIDGDIDPNNPECFSSLADAISGIFRFCMQMGFPRPSLIVHSGGGIHVYWLSNRVLSIEEWQPFADGMKNAIRIAGLTIKDIGVTGDAARVLRVPGTMNYKYTPARPVRLLPKYSPGGTFDFDVVFAKLLELAPPTRESPKKLNLGPVPTAFAGMPLKSLGEGIEGLTLSLAAIKTGCAWFREAYDTGGKNMTGNMQWNLLTLCATFMEDGNELAHKLVNQHPGYTHGSTEELWNRKVREHTTKNLGWPSCRAISNSGCGHCASCPHFPLGKSPLHLGLGVIEDAKPKKERSEEEVDEAIKELGGTRPKDLRLPPGYALDEEGRICAVIESKETSKGKLVEPARLLHLFKTQIKEPTLQFQNGRFGLGFTANTYMGNWQEVLVISSNLRGANLINFLTEKFVLPNPDETAEKLLVKFPISWIDLLRKTDTPIRDSGTMGWRYEDGKKVGFVFGNTLYHEDGSKFTLTSALDDEFRSHYQSVGRKEVWLQACKLLTDRKRPELDILIAVAFAAPLTAFSGTLYGATLSVWGEPSTSKSTAQQIAAAVFGHPKQTRESLNSTPKSIQGRLGRTRNLAAYWDDIQSEQHQDNLFQTMFVTAGGTEGGRLNSDSTMKARLDWQTLLVACSNASFIEYLARKQKSTTAGMRRVFEFEFNRKPNEPGIINALEASRVFASLEHNYGVIGAEYAAMLACEHKQINDLVRDLTNKFEVDVVGTGDESYWVGLCGVLLAGATLANRLGANLDVEAMDEFLQKAFEDNRRLRGSEGTEGGSLSNTEIGLVSFMNEAIGKGNTLFVDKMFVHRRTKVTHLKAPGDKCQIFVQVAHDEHKIYISRKAMREHLIKAEMHSRQVFDGLANYYHAKEVRVTLGAGTDFAQSQEKCFEIPVPPDETHVLQEIMISHGNKGLFRKPNPSA